MQRLPLPTGPASAHGASLPHCSRHRIVQNPHPRYKTEPQEADHREGDRAGRVLQKNGVRRVSDPVNPKKTGSIHLGGIVRRAAHPKKPKEGLNGGPQMVEISRDGKRVYFTNSLYSPWDAQFYPDGVKSWMAKIDASPNGGMKLDETFFVEFGELRAHQVRLEGGDASSDSYCYSEAP
jgi:hypothetical protein